MLVRLWLIDFVVPIVHQRRCSVRTAWRNLLTVYAHQPGEMILYVAWRVVLLMVIALLMASVFLLVMLLGILISAVVVLLGALLAKLIPVLTIPLAIVGAVLVALVVVAFAILAIMFTIPGPVELRFLNLIRDAFPKRGTGRRLDDGAGNDPARRDFQGD